MEKGSRANEGRTETTLGELIEIITEIALEDGKSESEAYNIVSLTLENIVNRRIPKVELIH